MVVSLQQTGVKINRESKEIEMTASESKQYVQLVPEGLGGKNPHARMSDIANAVKLCYEICTRGIVNDVVKRIKRGGGCFVVAKDISHQKQLFKMFVNKGIRDSDIFLVEKGASICFSDDTVCKKVTPNYKIVIATIRYSSGYTLTKLATLVTSVYPSNNATREQLEGRINRIGQNAKEVNYITIHTGILSHIHERHAAAKSLSLALEGISKEAHIIA